MKIADFKIKIKGFDFTKEDDGFVSTGLYQDDNKKLFICIPTRMHAGLSAQIDKLVHDANFSEFGLLIETKEAKYNETDAEINFSQSQFVTIKTINSQHIHFYIDIAIITYADTSSQNKATFLLNHAGFEVIQNFYNISLPTGEEYKLPEIKKDYRLVIDKSVFYPKFKFSSHESLSEQEISIKKVPFIKSDSFDLENILYDFDCLLQILRIYYHVDVDYLEGSVYYKDKTQVIYKSANEAYNFRIEPLNRTLLKTPSDIETFISRVDTNLLSQYIQPITNIIDSKLTSSLLNGKTRYLVLYNVLENLQNIKQKQKGYKQNKDEFADFENIKAKFDSFLDEILSSVAQEEHEDFEKVWRSKCPQYKPAISPAYDFISHAGLDVSKINELIKEYTTNKYENIIKLRNDITHGKTVFDGVDFDKVNGLLSLITTLLLFDVIGLKDYDLKKFKNSIIKNKPSAYTLDAQSALN